MLARTGEIVFYKRKHTDKNVTVKCTSTNENPNNVFDDFKKNISPYKYALR